MKQQLATPQTSITYNGSPPKQTAGAVAAREGSLDDALGIDESAQRMDKIIAAMLLYFSQTGHLPAQLDELRVLDAGLPLENPAHQAYVYIPNGLRSPASANRIILHDPATTASGRRWCIVQISPGKGTQAQLETQAIPENLFLGYLPPR